MWFQLKIEFLRSFWHGFKHIIAFHLTASSISYNQIICFDLSDAVLHDHAPENTNITLYTMIFCVQNPYLQLQTWLISMSVYFRRHSSKWTKIFDITMKNCITQQYRSILWALLGRNKRKIHSIFEVIIYSLNDIEISAPLGIQETLFKKER